MSVQLPRRASRRTVLGLGLAAAAAVGGCSTTDTAPLAEADPSTGPTTPAGPGGAGAAGGADGADDPDTALVARLVVEISRAHARVRANRRAHRPLAPDLLALERLHARHAVELGGLAPVAASTVRAEERQDRVRARLADVEDRLQQRLVDDSVAAESGALALLIAAMAAGVAQEASRL